MKIAVTVRSAVCVVCQDKRQVLQIRTVNGRAQGSVVPCLHCQRPFIPVVEVIR